MFTKSTVAVARSESNKLNATHRAQASIGPSAVAGSSPTGTILDFVRARDARSAARVREAQSNENQDGFTLADLVAIAGLFLATAFYPAITWLLTWGSVN
jgi:hypothetical protein